MRTKVIAAIAFIMVNSFSVLNIYNALKHYKADDLLSAAMLMNLAIIIAISAYAFSKDIIDDDKEDKK